MGIQAAKAADKNQDREQLIAELSAENGPDWAEPYKPGSYGCHELLDRTSLAGDFLEGHILSHPACVQNAEWYALAEQAVSALRELYQRIGAEHLEAEKEPST